MTFAVPVLPSTALSGIAVVVSLKCALVRSAARSFLGRSFFGTFGRTLGSSIGVVDFTSNGSVCRVGRMHRCRTGAHTQTGQTRKFREPQVIIRNIKTESWQVEARQSEVQPRDAGN